MARCIPEEPTFVTESERQVWERLRDGLPHDCVLIANLRLTDQEKDHEIDLLVLVPEAGFVCLEVKGGSVWLEDDGWWIKCGEKVERCDPVGQAREGKHAVRRYVEADPRWGSRDQVAFSHGVVLPHTDLADDFSVPELPRWGFHGRGEMADLSERVRTNAWGSSPGETRRRPEHGGHS